MTHCQERCRPRASRERMELRPPDDQPPFAAYLKVVRHPSANMILLSLEQWRSSFSVEEQQVHDNTDTGTITGFLKAVKQPPLPSSQSMTPIRDY